MLQSNWNESFLRQARFEAFEERLVLSGQPVGDLVAPQSDQAAPEFVDVAPTLADVNESTGVDYAHESFGFTGKGQTVAVIDTGVAYDHTSLGGGFGENHRVIGGWDFAENDANPYDDGPTGYHGTHVAGIVGSDHATHTGVAPDADIVALRVFDDLGFGKLEWVESALQWVQQHRVEYNITTVNLSLGTSWNADTVPAWAQLENEFQQLKADGVFISVAAGNSFSSYNQTGLSYPAASPHVVPVASHGADGQLSDFSQRNDRVLVAPGEQISSAIPSHLFGGSGASSYFMSLSGTSMAAPYMAGASTVLREAMDFAGIETINQDTLYDHFRSTADMVYDAVTGANYHRLNLESALDNLLADEYGSDATTAHSLGALQGDESFDGMIGRLDDVDFFTFTAGKSGTMTLSASTTHDMSANWQLVGGGGTVEGDALSFEVEAGKVYQVALGSTGGLGRYTVDVQLEAVAEVVAVDWGTIDFAQFQGESVAGQQWYQLTASRSGILTVESLFAHSAGNVDIEIYDANNQLVSSSNSLTDNERLDIDAQAGDLFYVKVNGTNAGVDFRVTNLVHADGGQLHVHGTASNDSFSFAAGSTHRLSVNGVEYQFNGRTTTSVQFHGEQGHDSISLTGTAGSEVATLRAGSADVSGSGYRVTADEVENIAVRGGGGYDQARLYGTGGDETLVARPDAVTMDGSGFSNSAIGFNQVRAYAGGGTDRAEMFDSAGSDRFFGRSTYSLMRGVGFYNYASGFDEVHAYATAGGRHDQAWLYDTAGDDSLVAGPDESTLSGRGYLNHVKGFDRVDVYAMAGGNDSAEFFDSAGSDQFFAWPGYASMRGANFHNFARGFDSVTAHSVTGGYDRAFLFGSRGSDQLEVSREGVQLSGRGMQTGADGFDFTWVDGGGGADQAVFREIGSDDSFLRSGSLTRYLSDQGQVTSYRFSDVQVARGGGFYAGVSMFDLQWNKLRRW